MKTALILYIYFLGKSHTKQTCESIERRFYAYCKYAENILFEARAKQKPIK